MPHRERSRHDQEARTHPDLARKVVLAQSKRRERSKLVDQVQRNAQQLKDGKRLPSDTIKVKNNKQTRI